MDPANWRILNRVTFGPRPAERRQIAAIGAASFIEEQLAPNTLPDMPLGPRLALRRLESLHLAAADLFDIAEEVTKTRIAAGRVVAGRLQPTTA